MPEVPLVLESPVLTWRRPVMSRLRRQGNRWQVSRHPSRYPNRHPNRRPNRHRYLGQAPRAYRRATRGSVQPVCAMGLPTSHRQQRSSVGSVHQRSPTSRWALRRSPWRVARPSHPHRAASFCLPCRDWRRRYRARVSPQCPRVINFSAVRVSPAVPRMSAGVRRWGLPGLSGRRSPLPMGQPARPATQHPLVARRFPPPAGSSLRLCRR